MRSYSAAGSRSMTSAVVRILLPTQYGEVVASLSDQRSTPSRDVSGSDLAPGSIRPAPRGDPGRARGSSVRLLVQTARTSLAVLRFRLRRRDRGDAAETCSPAPVGAVPDTPRSPTAHAWTRRLADVLPGGLQSAKCALPRSQREASRRG